MYDCCHGLMALVSPKEWAKAEGLLAWSPTQLPASVVDSRWIREWSLRRLVASAM